MLSLLQLGCHSKEQCDRNAYGPLLAEKVLFLGTICPSYP